MNVNTNTKAVSLTKRESERLWQARNIILGLAKHADDELQKQAQEASVAVEKVIVTLQIGDAK
jgi:hypothetical protein